MGIINIYGSLSNEHICIHKNGILKELLPDYDFSKSVVLKAGHKITPDYKVTEDDIIFIRKIPGELATLAAIGSGIALVAGAVAIGKSINNSNKTKAMEEEMQKQQQAAEDLASTVEKLPFLRGARNRTAIGNTIPFIMGEMFHTPYLLNEGFYSIGGDDGKDQFWNAMLVVGYNKTRIKSISSGNAELLDLLASYDDTASQNGIYQVKDGVFQSYTGTQPVITILLEHSQTSPTSGVTTYITKLKQIRCTVCLDYDVYVRLTKGNSVQTYKLDARDLAVEGNPLIAVADNEHNTVQVKIYKIVSYTHSGSTSYVESELQSWSATSKTELSWTDEDFSPIPLSLIEIKDNEELTLSGFNQKVVSEFCGEEIKHENGTATADIPEIIKTLPENVQKFEICIQFDGLRQYSNNTWTYRTVEFEFLWSNNADEESPEWHSFWFDFSGDEWLECTDEKLNELIQQGTIIKSISAMGAEPFVTYAYTLRSNSDDIRIESTGSYSSWYTDGYYSQTEHGHWYDAYDVYYKNPNLSSSVTKNTKSTIRFTASKTFTAEESYDKTITLKIKRITPKLSGDANETALLQYINTYCFDAIKSSSSELIPCRPVEQPFRDKTLRIGLKLAANANTEASLEQINVLCGGCARTWDGMQWSEEKTITRNPASWVLEILTSDTHLHSKYDDSELDLQSFGAYYEYCAENEFYCDGIILKGEKKRDILDKILTESNAVLFFNTEGLLEIAIDKLENTPVALLNSQSIKSIVYTKNLGRKPTGYKTVYTNRNSWKVVTEYFMNDGRTSYTEGLDVLKETTLNYITDHNHAFKYIHFQSRKNILCPRKIKVSVGMEGDYYPLFSKVLLQMRQLKIGIQSSIIKSISQNTGVIQITDYVDFIQGKRYGVIIQAMNDNGRALMFAEVSGTGKTKTLNIVDTDYDWEILPEQGNILSFGYLDDENGFSTITSPMKIMAIEKGTDHGWELTLSDYNEALYETGEIPEYKSNITTYPGRTIKTMRTTSSRGTDGKNGGYMQYEYTVGDETMTAEQLEAATWSSTIPAVPSGQYLWRRTRWVEGS